MSSLDRCELASDGEVPARRAVLAEQPLDQAWLDYQHEIGLRHTRNRKNTTDHADSVAMADT